MSSDSNDQHILLRRIEGNPTTQINQSCGDFGKRWVDFFASQAGVRQAWMAQVDEHRSIHWMANWPMEGPSHKFPEETLQNVTGHGMTSIFQDSTNTHSIGLFPLLHENRVIGLVGLLCDQPDYFKPDTIQWITALTNAIAPALFLEESSSRERQTEKLIWQILQSDLDAYKTLPIALEVLANLLKADGVIAFSRHRPSRQFDLLLRLGVNNRDLEKLTAGFSAILENEVSSRGNRLIWIEDLWTPPPGLHPISPMREMGFRGYLMLPLIAQDGLYGVLELTWKTSHKVDIHQSYFLERVSDLLAVALRNDSTLKDLRLDNQALSEKYNAMIEGLSKTLELRDIETEGHTRRVSRLTMRLVKHMQIPQEQWDDIQRGALLHDIGKIGIPDAILLKPGSLTDQERQMMQLHVTYAYNILSPIITSQHTLDIVHHHHEHWNGTGYPDGLKELQIPLTARLFSVVDIFDALTSDRPYRPAWSRSQALNYLRDQAGIQLDPQVVKAFLEITDNQS